MTNYQNDIMKLVENKYKDDEIVKNDTPVKLGDRKTILYLFLVAGITILILLLIRFTIF